MHYAILWLAAAADDKATKIIIPSDIQGTAGIVASIGKIFKSDKTENNTARNCG